MSKLTTVVTKTSETYKGMGIYAVEPVHTNVGIVCCVASQHHLQDDEVITLDSLDNTIIPVTQNAKYIWVEQKEKK